MNNQQADEDRNQTIHHHDRLTKREREVLALVVPGLTNRLIGQRLGITEKTVECHMVRIFKKLGVKNRTEAAHVAHHHHILDEED